MRWSPLYLFIYLFFFVCRMISVLSLFSKPIWVYVKSTKFFRCQIVTSVSTSCVHLNQHTDTYTTLYVLRAKGTILGQSVVKMMMQQWNISHLPIKENEKQRKKEKKNQIYLQWRQYKFYGHIQYTWIGES